MNSERPKGINNLSMLAAHMIMLGAADIIESSESALRKDRRHEPGNAPPEIPQAPDPKSDDYKDAAARIRAENAERRLREIAKRQPKRKP